MAVVGLESQLEHVGYDPFFLPDEISEIQVKCFRYFSKIGLSRAMGHTLVELNLQIAFHCELSKCSASHRTRNTMPFTD